MRSDFFNGLDQSIGRCCDAESSHSSTTFRHTVSVSNTFAAVPSNCTQSAARAAAGTNNAPHTAPASVRPAIQETPRTAAPSLPLKPVMK
ncbi:hypothetical protein GCM10010468_76180 [Actinocorallia longicatena]|uniref:Uncharacterized protein n=1 Tax=Actinocorallia longicatena TaxID=111803 RepID=A0ABP6QMG6_9ACTN